jgi:hypothetical protein
MEKNVLSKLYKGEVQVELATSDDINVLNKDVQKAQYNDDLLLRNINKVADALSAIKVQLNEVNAGRMTSQKAWTQFDNRYSAIRKNAEKSLADIGMKWTDLGNAKMLDTTMDSYDASYRMVQDTKLPTL